MRKQVKEMMDKSTINGKISLNEVFREEINNYAHPEIIK